MMKEDIILTEAEIKLIKRKRKEEADYNKMISEKPTIYTGKRKGKIRLSDRNRTKCDVRNEKGDVWCDDSCVDRDTCPYSAK